MRLAVSLAHVASVAAVPFVVPAIAAIALAACGGEARSVPASATGAGSVVPAPSAPPSPPPLSPSAPAGVVDAGSALGAIRLALLGIRDDSGCTDDFDYFPHGGLQNLWCHRPADFTLGMLADDAKVDVFLGGPHTRAQLGLHDARSFGHYNPAFVRFLGERVVPERDDEFRKRSQAVFDHAALPLAEIFWRVHTKIVAEPDCFEREKKAYEAAIAQGTASYHERWFYFLNPAFCSRERTRGGKAPDAAWYADHGMDGNVDGNVTKSVVGFWMRRSIDGTFAQVSSLLTKIVDAYAPELAHDVRTSLPPSAPATPVRPRRGSKPVF